MKFDERTSFALHWAIIIGMVVATCLCVALTSCAHNPKKVIMVNCEKTNTEVPEGHLDLCEKY